MTMLHHRAHPSRATWAYVFVRLLFKFVLKIFYGSIVVENADLIPPDGMPCIFAANHSNSLTDAVLLVASTPSRVRSMLRLTAKSTQFGHKTFTSWLIESAGTVPIKRRKDFPEDAVVDNSEIMAHLIDVLSLGDAVCLFPEGMSRYHPTIAPLKTGVARLVSDVLTRNRSNPDFKVSIQTCSITYMHRQYWRSDVLITFHEPLIFSVKGNPELLAPVDFSSIRAVTYDIQRKISSGTLDSPSWGLVRTAKMATRIYAPLGTRMSLGDYVRVVRTFLEAFKTADTKHVSESPERPGDREESMIDAVEARKLMGDLKAYQDRLASWGIKDERIRRPLSRRTILKRLILRFFWCSFLLTISFPGLLLWMPIFLVIFRAVSQFKRTGPIWDTFDEIAQYKLVYGLASGVGVWALAVLLTLPFALVTIPGVPALMWLTLRWLEDAVSAGRACAAFVRLLRLGKQNIHQAVLTRAELHARVMSFATAELGLPPDPEQYFPASGGREKGRVTSNWESGRKYFSVRRRRKRDWNETLRLHETVDYPADE